MVRKSEIVCIECGELFYRGSIYKGNYCTECRDIEYEAY